MNSPDPNDPLSPTLAAWRVNPTSDPNFRPAVWARIQARARETWATYVRAHLLGWSVATVAVVAMAGWTGRTVAEARLDADRDRMVVSYLSELDPRVITHLSTQQP